MTRYAPALVAQQPAKVCPLCGLRYDPVAAFCQKDGARLTAEGAVDPFLGEVLLGQFRIDEAIGAGGMGTVYRAHQLNLHRDVAVKILHPELTQNPDAVRRFHREAKVATSLEHPNLVRVFLFGELQDGAGLYLVMEHLEGRSMTELMRQEGALAPPRALHLAAQLCDAIGAAHSQGIVHRDIKPENIIIVPRHGDPDFVKVLDFGIARLLWDDQTHLTQSGVIFGTARYISPEGAAGEFTDARSDVYSMGILIYQLLTGVTPFEANSPVAMLMKHINERAPDIRTMGAGQNIPAPIANVVMRALAKNPDARYDTASQLGEAFSIAASEANLGMPSRFSLTPGDSVAGRSFAQVTPPRVNSASMSGVLVPGLRKRRWPLIAAAFVFGAVAVVGGVMAAEYWLGESAAETALEENEARARHALAAGHFESPPGDNVGDLTLRILEEHPRHEGALSIRREAAALLRERAATARADGDFDAAREAYRIALVFSPADPLIVEALSSVDELEEAQAHADEVGLRIAPESARVGERVTFLGIVDHDAEIEGEGQFEIVSDGRVIKTLEAVEASEHHYVGGYTFRSRGDYTIRFSVGSGAGAVRFEQGLPVVSRNVARRDPPPTTSGVPAPYVQPVPTPPSIPTMDDGIDWTLPSDMRGTSNEAAPPPWTGEGSVI